MELYKEILAEMLRKEEVQVLFPNLRIDAQSIVELQCYQILQRIKEIVKDESLGDKECFLRIERIICIFEELGQNVGVRHDFG